MALPKVLFSTHSPPNYIPPLALSGQQIVVGPKYPDVVDPGGQTRSIKCQREFDVAALVRSLPGDQQPELFVALIDSYLECVPQNLDALSCRKILVIADTHHGRAPLSNLLAYCATERYDRFVLTHDPHHLHWFAEAGVSPVALQLNLNVRDYPFSLNSLRQPALIFVGLYKHHPRRVRLLNALVQAGIPVPLVEILPEQAAKLFAKTQLTFNCSLNGDLNMRVFEVLSAGGCLLTDRLSPAAGLEDLFTDGRDLILYDDEQDLIEKARYYLANPELCLRIAMSGHQRYMDTMAEPMRRQRFLQFALGDEAAALESAARDQGRDMRSRRRGSRLALRRRVMAYQRIQELQRIEAIDRVCCTPAIDDDYIEDLSDLHRLSVDRQVADGRRTCLLTTAAELGQILSKGSPPPADFLLVVDADADPGFHFADLRRFGYANMPGIREDSGRLYRAASTKPPQTL